MTKPVLAPATPELLLTAKELRARLRCHQATLQRWEDRGILKPIIIGTKFRRYRLRDIEELERKGSK